MGPPSLSCFRTNTPTPNRYSPVSILKKYVIGNGGGIASKVLKTFFVGRDSLTYKRGKCYIVVVQQLIGCNIIIEEGCIYAKSIISSFSNGGSSNTQIDCTRFPMGSV